MRRNLFPVLAAVLALSAGPGAAGRVAAEELGDAARRITVVGSAQVDAAPDLATITAGVETRASTAAEALTTTATAMAAVAAALSDKGVAPADMQTSQLSVEPVWATDGGSDGTPPAVVGYSATNLVTVRVRRVDDLGAIIDALGKAGANRMFGIAFDLADQTPAFDSARERAVADARARAELYARAAGVKLGSVMWISESSGGPGPMMLRAEAMASDMPVSAGSVTVSAQVEIVFAIE